MLLVIHAEVENALDELDASMGEGAGHWHAVAPQQPRRKRLSKKRAVRDLAQWNETPWHLLENSIATLFSRLSRVQSSSPSGASAPRRKRQRKLRHKGSDGSNETSAMPSSRGDRSGAAGDYDSDADAEETAADREFIDTRGDDAALLAEYNEQDASYRSRQSHLDEAVEDRGSRPLSKREQKRRGEMSAEEKDKAVVDLLQAMMDAAMDDRAARKAGRPALRKLALLDYARRTVMNASLHDSLVDGLPQFPEWYRGPKSVLEVFREWLRPLGGTSLPPLPLRTEIYHMVQALPLSKFHLHASRLGEVLFALSKHPSETLENRRFLHRFIDRFARAEFRKTASYKGQMDSVLDAEEKAHREEGIDRKAASKMPPMMTAPPRRASSQGAAAAAASAAAASESNHQGGDAENLMDEDVGGQADSANDTSYLARRPMPMAFDFLHEGTTSSAAEAGVAAARAAPAKRSNLQKRMQTERRAGKTKVKRGAQLSIEGRDMG